MQRQFFLTCYRPEESQYAGLSLMKQLLKTFIHIFVLMGAIQSHHEPHIHPEPYHIHEQDPIRQRVLSSGKEAT